MPNPRAERMRPASGDGPVLREIVRRLVEVYHPERIYFFGSTALGDPGPNSDYDLVGSAGSDQPDKCANGHTHAAQAGLTPHDSRVPCDAIQRRHDASPLF